MGRTHICLSGQTDWRDFGSCVIKLVLSLAAFEVLGEFVAQRKLRIDLKISFIIACLLLVLSAAQARRQDRNMNLEE